MYFIVRILEQKKNETCFFFNSLFFLLFLHFFPLVFLLLTSCIFTAHNVRRTRNRVQIRKIRSERIDNGSKSRVIVRYKLRPWSAIRRETAVLTGGCLLYKNSLRFVYPSGIRRVTHPP